VRAKQSGPASNRLDYRGMTSQHVRSQTFWWWWWWWWCCHMYTRILTRSFSSVCVSMDHSLGVYTVRRAAHTPGLPVQAQITGLLTAES